MTFAESIAQMNIELGDTGNVTFTIEEKQRAMTKAWNDSHTVRTIWDDSLTFSTTTSVYTVPNSLTTVKDIYISRSNSSADEPEKIASNLWEVIEGEIHFKQGANNIIPDGYTLYLKGNYKLTTSDNITETNLQEYVIALGGWETLRLLGFKKANLFLKNDTSMSELIALKRDFKQDVLEIRARLPREYESM